jgi:branched-subunit amino acid ABC-type transport system permease component
LYSFAGAGVGFLAGLLLILLLSRTTGPQPPSDTGPAALFVGVFLAGAGAVAGAVVGGVADLLAFFRRRDEAARNAQKRCEQQSRL